MKAIKIDVVKKEIYEVTIDHKNELKSIYNHLEADMFENALNIQPQNDFVYVDEEGLLKAPIGWFMIKGQSQLLSGHGLVVGCGRDGESRDVGSTVEEIRNIVVFR